MGNEKQYCSSSYYSSLLAAIATLASFLFPNICLATIIYAGSCVITSFWFAYKAVSNHETLKSLLISIGVFAIWAAAITFHSIIHGYAEFEYIATPLGALLTFFILHIIYTKYRLIRSQKIHQ